MNKISNLDPNKGFDKIDKERLREITSKGGRISARNKKVKALFRDIFKDALEKEFSLSVNEIVKNLTKRSKDRDNSLSLAADFLGLKEQQKQCDGTVNLESLLTRVMGSGKF